jgi:hypothetical protein
VKTFFWIAAGLVAFFTLAALAEQWRRRAARRTILGFDFPPFLRARLREHHPGLSDAQAARVEQGLRQFFIASAMARRRYVAMPSKVVDSLWHEFILHTRGYERFCRQAFGHLLHHVPAEAMPPDAASDRTKAAGLRRAWYWSCREEGIDPRKPARLPTLFALDAALAVAGGYHYVPDCTLLGADRGHTHCASGIGCGSSCGSGCGSDGGGDGGGGCGGD